MLSGDEFYGDDVTSGLSDLPRTERVNGVAVIGDLVTYEDMANFPMSYRVTRDLAGSGSSGEYELRDVETGEFIWSDLRQYGWTRA
jgi:hypothetical protein